MYLCLIEYQTDLSWTFMEGSSQLFYLVFFLLLTDYNWVKRHVVAENSCGRPLTTSCDREKEGKEVFKIGEYLDEI